jgi:F420-0:gamma-glutamyl ligase
MALVKREAERYLVPAKSKWRRIFTLKHGAIIGSSGVDESTGDGYYVLLPRNPVRSAQRLRAWLMRTYGVHELGVIFTDSTSIPLRRGAIGIALAYAGIEPLRDYRGTADLFGRPFKMEVANLADMLASSAVLCMGEGAERTPVAVIRNAPGIVFSGTRRYRGPGLAVSPEDDLFAPLLFSQPWKRGGAK